MAAGPRIAIDAMGGDAGPAAMIAGAARALRKDPVLRFTFYGDEGQVEAQLDKHRAVADSALVVHSPEAIAALRRALDLSAKHRAVDPKARDIAADVQKDPRFANLRQTPEFQ